MASRSFLPTSDAALLAWAQNFSTKITATPTAFGLVAGQATTFAGLLTTYQTALAVVTDPNAKTKTAVTAKDNARAALKTDARNLSKIVEGTSTVTNVQKESLGLNVRSAPTPIPPPSVPPALDIVSVTGRTVKCRAHNADDTKRGKPAGCAGVFVYSHVGATAPTDPSAYTFQGTSTRPVFDVAFPDSVAAGSQVWISVAWFNPRTQTGPACAPATAYLQITASAAA